MPLRHANEWINLTFVTLDIATRLLVDHRPDLFFARRLIGLDRPLFAWHLDG